MWITAKIFGRGLVKTEDKCGMIMELPPYHKPKWGSLMRYVFGRTKDTFFRVVKVVLLVCGISWLISYGGTSGESSVLEKIGLAIEPVTKLVGLPWQLFVAFIASSVGKEGAVGVISALYSGGSVGAAFTEAMSGGAAAAPGDGCADPHGAGDGRFLCSGPAARAGDHGRRSGASGTAE
jgi:ferrous iron transport protein B